MTQLSKNFSLREFTKSESAERYGIDNTPNSRELERIQRLVDNVLQPLRDKLGEPITITSGFRSAHLNRVIGGASISQHTLGEAVDFKCKDMSYAFAIIRHKFDFDQLIWEFGNKHQPDWIHVSYKEYGNRNEVLVATKVDGKTKYRKM